MKGLIVNRFRLKWADLLC